MVETKQFKKWLKEETNYSDAVISDIASRMKRADNLIEWNGENTYQFFLEQDERYREMSVSVRSQIKKSVKLYAEYSKRLEHIQQ